MVPDKGWAWMVLLGSILSSMVLCGSFKSTRIFYVEFLEKYRSRPTVTTLLSAMQIMLVAIIGPLGSWLSQRYSARITVILGCTMSSIAWFSTAYAPNIYVAIALFSFTGAGGIFVNTAVLPFLMQHFERKRSIAGGIASAGGSVGLIIIPIMIRYTLDEYALRGALIIMAGITLHYLITAALSRPITNKNNKHSTSDEHDLHAENMLANSHKHCLQTIGSEQNNVSKRCLFVEKDKHGFSDFQQCAKLLPRRGQITCPKVPIKSSCRQVPSEKWLSFSLNNIVIHETDDLLKGQKRQEGQNLNSHKIDTYINVDVSALKPIVKANRKTARNPVVSGHMNSCKAGNLRRFSTSEGNLPIESLVAKEEDMPRSISTFVYPDLGFGSVCSIPFADTAKNHNTTQTFNVSCAKNPLFWIYTSMVCTGYYGYNQSLFLFPAYARECGLDDSFSASMLSLTATIELFSRLVVGGLGNHPKVSKARLLQTCYLIAGLFTLVLPHFPSKGMLVAFAIVTGMFGGSAIAIFLSIFVDYVGVEEIFSAQGLHTTTSSLIGATFPFLIGALREWTGTYSSGIRVCAVLYLLTVFISMLEPCARKLKSKLESRNNTNDTT